MAFRKCGWTRWYTLRFHLLHRIAEYLENFGTKNVLNMSRLEQYIFYIKIMYGDTSQKQQCWIKGTSQALESSQQWAVSPLETRIIRKFWRSEEKWSRIRCSGTFTFWYGRKKTLGELWKEKRGELFVVTERKVAIGMKYVLRRFDGDISCLI